MVSGIGATCAGAPHDDSRSSQSGFGLRRPALLRPARRILSSIRCSWACRLSSTWRPYDVHPVIESWGRCGARDRPRQQRMRDFCERQESLTDGARVTRLSRGDPSHRRRWPQWAVAASSRIPLINKRWTMSALRMEGSAHQRGELKVARRVTRYARGGAGPGCGRRHFPYLPAQYLARTLKERSWH